MVEKIHASYITKTVREEDFTVRRETIKLHGPDGEQIGHAKLEFFDEPVNFCHVADVRIDENYQNQKHGRTLVESFTEYLSSKKLVGLLYNNIKDKNILARTVYQNRGWKNASGWPGWMTHGLPAAADKKLVDRMIQTVRIELGWVGRES